MRPHYYPLYSHAQDTFTAAEGYKTAQTKTFHSSLYLHTKMTNAFLLGRAKPRK